MPLSTSIFLKLVTLFFKRPLTAVRALNTENILKLKQAIENKLPVGELEEAIATELHNYKVNTRNSQNGKAVAKINYRVSDLDKLIFRELFDFDFFKLKEEVEDITKDEAWERISNNQSIHLNPLFDLDYFLGQQKTQYDSVLEAFKIFLTEKHEHSPHHLFDSVFYLKSNPDVLEAGINPLHHYWLHGDKENRNPHPLFHAHYYKSQFSELREVSLAHYINSGHSSFNPNPLFDRVFFKKEYEVSSNENPLIYYLKNSNKASKTHDLFDGANYTSLIDNPIENTPLEHYFLTQSNKSTSRDKSLLKQVLGRSDHNNSSLINLSSSVLNQIELAKKIEPIILQPGRTTKDVFHYKLPHQDSYELAFYKDINADLSHSTDLVFLFSTLRRGGAELEAIKIITSIIKHSQKKLVIIFTDPILPEALDWLPNSTNISVIDYQTLQPRLNEEQRISITAHLLTYTNPKVVINCNSRIGWDTYYKYGHSLSSVTDLYAMLFCYDYDTNRRKAGYAVDYIRDCIDHLDTIMTDNDSFIEELFYDYGFVDSLRSKFTSIKYTPNKSLKPTSRALLLERLDRCKTKDRKLKIFWASRICNQKRPDIILNIAALCPDYEFHIWGNGDIARHISGGIKGIPDNVKIHGGYEQIEDIPYHTYDVFLYTSEWDGIPNILVDMAHLNFPIITPDIGGITELLDDSNAWIINDINDVNAYINALEAIIQDLQLTQRKLEKLDVDLEAKHGESKFIASLKSLELL